MFQSFMFHPKKGFTVSQSPSTLELTMTFGFSLQLPRTSLALMDMRDIGRQVLASLCHTYPEWSKLAIEQTVQSNSFKGVVKDRDSHSVKLSNGEILRGVWVLKGEHLYLDLYKGKRERIITGTDLDAIILLRSFLMLVQSLLDDVKCQYPLLFESTMSKHWIRRRQFLSVA